MATEIKFTAGDKVFWLSSGGFKKGIVKTVVLTDTVNIYHKKHSKKKEVKFLLWSEDYAEVYIGDAVKENEIFSSYKEMIKYYSEKTIK